MLFLLHLLIAVLLLALHPLILSKQFWTCMGSWHQFSNKFKSNNMVIGGLLLWAPYASSFLKSSPNCIFHSLKHNPSFNLLVRFP